MKRHDEINELVRQVTSLARGERPGDQELPYESFFMIKIDAVIPEDTFDQSVATIRSELVALLIGADKPQFLRDDVVERVWAASKELNIKAAREVLLVNRQGLLYLLPKGKRQGPHLHRFENTRDLVILALYVKAFLRDDHGYAARDLLNARDLVNKIEQWVSFPQLTFDASMSHSITWRLLVDHFMLRDRLDAWFRFIEGIGWRPERLPDDPPT